LENSGSAGVLEEAEIAIVVSSGTVEGLGLLSVVEVEAGDDSTGAEEVGGGGEGGGGLDASPGHDTV
jgi:hypothetical protein